MANAQNASRDQVAATTAIPASEQPTVAAASAGPAAAGGAGAAGAAGAGPGSAVPAAAPASTPAPIPIDGAAIVPPGKISPAVALADNKEMTSSELFSADGVTISRETVAVGINPTTGTRIGSADQFQNTLVITTGNDNDQVNVSQRADGTLDVDINGKAFHVRLGPGQELGVRTGDGDDMIHAAGNVTVNMDVRAGAGNDSITTAAGNDRIDAGAGDDMVRSGDGRDDVFGNSGNDIIDTGDGHDVAYGGDGDDVLRGGRGSDYLEGGKGGDTLQGGSGEDILSGGLGDDALLGQQGDDHVYTGAGRDTVSNDAGNDKVYGQTAEDTITANTAASATNAVDNVAMATAPGSSIVISGSPEFQQRVEADLEFLRSSPQGRGLLTELDAAAAAPGGNKVTIREMTHEHNGRAFGVGDVFLGTDASGNVVPGRGSNATVEYNPSDHSDQFPNATVTLFHELSHAYNYVTGTAQQGVSGLAGPDNGEFRREMQAAGVATDGLSYNFPGGSAPSIVNPFNENTLRDEMGLPQRPAYNPPSTWGGGLGSPTAMAPGGTGGTSFASTGDPVLDRMLAASDSGDIHALASASGSLYERDGGSFKEQGVADFAREQTARSQAESEKMAAAQIEQPEEQVARSRGMSR